MTEALTCAVGGVGLPIKKTQQNTGFWVVKRPEGTGVSKFVETTKKVLLPQQVF
jgi:hypothetical protein